MGRERGGMSVTKMRNSAMKTTGTIARSTEIASSSASGAHATHGGHKGQHRARNMKMTTHTATAPHRQMCSARNRSRAQGADTVTCSAGLCGLKYRICSMRTHSNNYNSKNNNNNNAYTFQF